MLNDDEIVNIILYNLILSRLLGYNKCILKDFKNIFKIILQRKLNSFEFNLDLKVHIELNPIATRSFVLFLNIMNGSP